VNETKRDFTVNIPAKIAFEIFSLLGSKVATVKAEEYQTGLQTIDLPVDELANGNYFVNMLVEDSRIDIRKFSVMH
jgi:hypothetical protein